MVYIPYLTMMHHENGLVLLTGATMPDFWLDSTSTEEESRGFGESMRDQFDQSFLKFGAVGVS